jgi:hypothetical protein
MVSKIPNFDPSKLPFWETFVREGVASTIKVGGTMAGEFTAGFSGGQRKLLLFELIYQRTLQQSGLLIALDEPFSGVTDDFVPFIVERLKEMQAKHNIILVTNDHVETLTKMADNTITVSAIDRLAVRINDREAVNREKTIMALSVGDTYTYTSSRADLKFFFDVEVLSNGSLMGIGFFSTFCFSLFIAAFWDSAEESAALVLVAGGIISFFCVNPYLLSLVEWRNAMLEESEALLHASKGMNKMLKFLLTLSIVVVISVVEFGVVNAVIDGLSSVQFWVGIMFDSASLTFPQICLGLYTRMPFQACQILGSLPFLLMIFLSTTFSPGAGVAGLKELRYLYARFYLWCMTPGVEDLMEGCPSEDLNILYLILSAFLGTFIFLAAKFFLSIRRSFKKIEAETRRASIMDTEFHQLQVELYGTKALRRLQHLQPSGISSEGVAVSDDNNSDGQA